MELALSSGGNGWLPVDSLPVGLVTWYGPTGVCMALVTSWLGIIDGQPPELRAGCCSRTPGPELFPDGADFAVSIPADPISPALRDLLMKPQPGGPLVFEAGSELLPARRVHAPLLASSTLRIECSHGRFLPRDWEAELAGEILLLCRGHLSFNPADHPDFMALSPLRRLGCVGP